MALGAAVAGRNAAVGLYFRGIGAVVRGEVVPGFNSAVSIPEGKTVGRGDGKESCEGTAKDDALEGARPEEADY